MSAFRVVLRFVARSHRGVGTPQLGGTQTRRRRAGAEAVVPGGGRTRRVGERAWAVVRATT